MQARSLNNTWGLSRHSVKEITVCRKQTNSLCRLNIRSFKSLLKAVAIGSVQSFQMVFVTACYEKQKKQKNKTNQGITCNVFRNNNSWHAVKEIIKQRKNEWGNFEFFCCHFLFICNNIKINQNVHENLCHVTLPRDPVYITIFQVKTLSFAFSFQKSFTFTLQCF